MATASALASSRSRARVDASQAVLRQACLDRAIVRRANLMRRDRLTGVDELVARRDHGDARQLGDERRRTPGAGEHGDLRRAEARAGAQHEAALRAVAAAPVDELLGRDRRVGRDRRRGAAALHALDRHDGVRAARQGRARHDLDALRRARRRAARRPPPGCRRPRTSARRPRSRGRRSRCRPSSRGRTAAGRARRGRPRRARGRRRPAKARAEPEISACERGSSASASATSVIRLGSRRCELRGCSGRRSRDYTNPGGGKHGPHHDLRHRELSHAGPGARPALADPGAHARTSGQPHRARRRERVFGGRRRSAFARRNTTKAFGSRSSGSSARRRRAIARRRCRISAPRMPRRTSPTSRSAIAPSRIGINDANWRAYSNRAYAYYLKRMFDEADADLDVALSINPNAQADAADPRHDERAPSARARHDGGAPLAVWPRHVVAAIVAAGFALAAETGNAARGAVDPVGTWSCVVWGHPDVRRRARAVQLRAAGRRAVGAHRERRPCRRGAGSRRGSRRIARCGSAIHAPAGSTRPICVATLSAAPGAR